MLQKKRIKRVCHNCICYHLWRSLETLLSFQKGACPQYRILVRNSILYTAPTDPDQFSLRTSQFRFSSQINGSLSNKGEKCGIFFYSFMNWWGHNCSHFLCENTCYDSSMWILAMANSALRPKGYCNLTIVTYQVMTSTSVSWVWKIPRSFCEKNIHFLIISFWNWYMENTNKTSFPWYCSWHHDLIDLKINSRYQNIFTKYLIIQRAVP